MTERAERVSSDDQNKEARGKCTKKKKKKQAKVNGTPAAPKPADFSQKTPAAINQPNKSTKKPPASKPKTQTTSDSSSSSSDEDVVPKKPPASTPAASKAPSNTKPAPRKPHPPPSSSSETESCDKAASVKSCQPKNKPLKTTTTDSESNQAPADLQTVGVVEPTPDLDSDEEIQLVIRRPLQQPGFGLSVQSPGRGRGRGKARRGGGQGEGRGAVRGHGGSFESSYNGGTEPSYQNDSLTNTSVILQVCLHLNHNPHRNRVKSDVYVEEYLIPVHYIKIEI